MEGANVGQKEERERMREEGPIHRRLGFMNLETWGGFLRWLVERGLLQATFVCIRGWIETLVGKPLVLAEEEEEKEELDVDQDDVPASDIPEPIASEGPEDTLDMDDILAKTIKVSGKKKRRQKKKWKIVKDVDPITGMRIEIASKSVARGVPSKSEPENEEMSKPAEVTEIETFQSPIDEGNFTMVLSKKDRKKKSPQPPVISSVEDAAIEQPTLTAEQTENGNPLFKAEIRKALALADCFTLVESKMNGKKKALSAAQNTNNTVEAAQDPEPATSLSQPSAASSLPPSPDSTTTEFIPLPATALTTPEDALPTTISEKTTPTPNDPDQKQKLDRLRKDLLETLSIADPRATTEPQARKWGDADIDNEELHRLRKDLPQILDIPDPQATAQPQARKKWSDKDIGDEDGDDEMEKYTMELQAEDRARRYSGTKSDAQKNFQTDKPEDNISPRPFQTQPTSSYLFTDNPKDPYLVRFDDGFTRYARPEVEEEVQGSST